MIRLLLSTASLIPYSYKEIFSIARDTGFDGLELVIDSRCLRGDLNKIKNLINLYNLPIYAVHQPLFIFFKKPGVKRGLKLSFDIAKKLQSESVTIHLPLFLRPDNSYTLVDNYSRQFLKAISEIRKELSNRSTKDLKTINKSNTSNGYLLNGNLKPKIALETVLDRKLNLGKRYFTDPEVLINYAVKQNLFITFDTTHHGLRSYSLEDSFDILKSRVINIHLSNTRRRKHEPPYSGKIPLKNFLKFILDKKYDSFITLEISPFALNFWSKKRVREKLKRSIYFCKKYT